MSAGAAGALDFSGKGVFVAGGSSGINLGVARRFAEAGAKVAIFARNPDKLDAARASLGPQALSFRGDVREFDAVQAAIDAAAAAFGGLQVVVSGAAGNFVAPAETISTNGWKAVNEIDALGTFHVFKAAFEPLKASRGSAIAISAPQSVQPMAWQAHVCAAKAGVDKLVECLAMEWGPHGVRVNAISPGPIANTEGMARLAPSPEIEDIVRRTVSLERFGEAREIGDVALFLASPLASYVTGAILPADGGWGLSGAGAATALIAEHFRSTL
ncbi:MAG: SDR family oxidoreductase [Oceanicaulis sp.]